MVRTPRSQARVAAALARAAAASAARARLSVSKATTRDPAGGFLSPNATKVGTPASAKAMPVSAAPVRSSAMTATSSMASTRRGRVRLRCLLLVHALRRPGAAVPPGGDDGHEDGRDNDARRDPHRRGSGCSLVGRVGCGHDGGRCRRVSGGGSGGTTRDPVSTSQLVDDEQDDAGDADHRHSQPDAEQARLPYGPEIDGGAEGESEEGDDYGNRLPEDGAHLAVQVAEQHPDGEREDGADQGLPGKGGEAGD